MTLEEQIEFAGYVMDMEKLLEFRNILQKMQLYLEIHFVKCPRGKQEEHIKAVNQYIDAANGLLEVELNRAAHRLDQHFKTRKDD